jgi:hypothetical protein
MKIDDTIIIPCPLAGFALRRAAHCLKCDHYLGMARATVNGVPVETESVDDYHVICGKPITRRMQRIVE